MVSTSLLDTSQGFKNVRLRFPQNHGIPGAGDFKRDPAAPDCDLVGLWCTTSKSFSLLPIPQEQLGLLPVGYIPPQLYRVLLGCTGLYWIVLGCTGLAGLRLQPTAPNGGGAIPRDGFGAGALGDKHPAPGEPRGPSSCSHPAEAHVGWPGWPRARCGVGAVGLGLGRRERAVCFVSHWVPLGGFRSISQLDPRYLE